MNGDVISEAGEDDRRRNAGVNERVVRKVLKEEIMGALKKMKGDIVSGISGIVVEMLKREPFT